MFSKLHDDHKYFNLNASIFINFDIQRKKIGNNVIIDRKESLCHL